MAASLHRDPCNTTFPWADALICVAAPLNDANLASLIPFV
jgi:hypothetical protein